MQCTAKVEAQDFNLGFEEATLRAWSPVGKPEDFRMGIDSTVYFEGGQSLFIQNAVPTQNFGGMMQFLPHNLKGDSIEVSVMVKLLGVIDPSKLGFILRIDPNIHFTNSYEENIHGTRDWKRYSIKGKLDPARTSAIAFGVFLSGQGRVWADKFEVLVDGKPIHQAMYSAFVPDYSSITTSGVKAVGSSAIVHARLKEWAQIWGLLKYRHPELAKGQQEWDQQLFATINKINQSNDLSAMEQHYMEMLDKLGTVVAAASPAIATEIKQQSNYDWIEQLPYSAALKERLSALQYASFTNHYYYRFTPQVGNVVIENEYPYSHLENPDVGFRLLSLFRYWNIVHYFSPYRYLVGQPWTSVLDVYIPKMIASNTALEYQITSAAMLTEMKDAHTKLWNSPAALRQWMGERTAPARIQYVEGKPMVIQLDSNFLVTSGLQVGDIILEKNGKTIKEIQDSVFYLISSPNAAVIAREMASVVLRSNRNSDTFLIDRKGKTLKVELASIKQGELKIAQDTVAVKYLADGIAYLNQGYLTKKILKEHEAQLRLSKAIVIDCRNYPKEFLVFVLTPELLSYPTPFVKFSATSYQQLGVFPITKALTVGALNSKAFAGKVAILLNENSQSSSEYHAMAYRVAPKAKVFGSQTAGADGNVSGFYLPGGLYSTLSGIGIYYPDNGETQRIGIIPDMEVKPTVEGMRAGRDEVLEQALEYLKTP